MSYRHDRRRKLIRRWKREGWKLIGWSDGNPVFTAKVGTLPSVAAMKWAGGFATHWDVTRALQESNHEDPGEYTGVVSQPPTPCEDHVHPGEGK